ncbi:nigerythrin [Raoultibacter timonensis]|uniref:Nigerythrin n=1 Tax=Raoultibacter timonensis TaxID=1907662 RepID=A0ABN6MLK8_9ACTN|nr:nigerythrin [Raoultibacter timonensis]BDF52149.1 nigerythrin [Raoultibacter timonensis]
MTMKVRDAIPTPDNSTNFSIASDSKTVVGSTLDNLKAAIAGETGASAKYTAFAKAAKEQGYDQIARLFEATAAAEQIHIGLEYGLVSQIDPDYEKPSADAPAAEASDLNLISGACGEIYETSDMYPAFIKKAQEEGETKAVQVFTRAKLAESVHAERYLDAYNNLDAADDDTFYLCPICGYIHKGEDFEKCPICFAPKDKFTAF